MKTSDFFSERTIAVTEVMRILDRFEQKAIEAIQTDKQIDADPYDNIGQLKLIQSIKKRIRKELKVNPPNAPFPFFPYEEKKKGEKEDQERD